jgi:hypothetical protein
MKSLLSFVISTLLVAGCDKGALFYAENDSDLDLLLRYQERGGYMRVYELPSDTGLAVVFAQMGGARGQLVVLSEDCEQVGPDLTPAEFGVTVVVVAKDGGVSAIQKPIDSSSLPGLEEVFDRCQ